MGETQATLTYIGKLSKNEHNTAQETILWRINEPDRFLIQRNKDKPTTKQRSRLGKGCLDKRNWLTLCSNISPNFQFTSLVVAGV